MTLLNTKPVFETTIECNTFSFYIKLTKTHKVVVFKHFTDFSGTSLEKDFPKGSTEITEYKMPLNYADLQAVNIIGKQWLKDWVWLKEDKVQVNPLVVTAKKFLETGKDYATVLSLLTSVLGIVEATKVMKLAV